MEIYLVRHAIAAERDAEAWPDDSLRPLTDRGRRRFRAAARGLRALGAAVEVSLSSPYVRAWETAQIAQAEAGWPAPAPCEALAIGNPASVVRVLAEQRGRGSVGVVGHEPLLSEVLAYLLAGSARAMTAEWKKGGVARVQCWGAPAEGRGALLEFLPPRVLRALAP